MKRILLLIAVVAAALLSYVQQAPQDPASSSQGSSPAQTQTSASRTVPASATAAIATDAIERAFAGQRSNLQVEVQGKVSRVLSDDNDGSRHQRFVVALPSGHTVLVAHNIDLADRVADLQSGDTITLYGEYEWNTQGGVMHWTHHDPDGSHVDGWIKHRGRTYQ